MVLMVLERRAGVEDCVRPADSQVREAVRPGLQGERGGDRLGQADAQAECPGSPQDHRGEVFDRDSQILQRSLRARPDGDVPGRNLLCRQPDRAGSTPASHQQERSRQRRGQRWRRR